MIVYRGTPIRETRPKRRSTLTIHFAKAFDLAKRWASGDYSNTGEGYIQEYSIPRQRLLNVDIDSQEAIEILSGYLGHEPSYSEMDAFYYDPPKDFLDILKDLGFTGFTGRDHVTEGGEIALFDARDVKLLARWKSSTWGKELVREL